MKDIFIQLNLSHLTFQLFMFLSFSNYCSCQSEIHFFHLFSVLSNVIQYKSISFMQFTQNTTCVVVTQFNQSVFDLGSEISFALRHIFLKMERTLSRLFRPYVLLLSASVIECDLSQKLHIVKNTLVPIYFMSFSTRQLALFLVWLFQTFFVHLFLFYQYHSDSVHRRI